MINNQLGEAPRWLFIIAYLGYQLITHLWQIWSMNARAENVVFLSDSEKMSEQNRFATE